jgi:hypothetical protein
VDRTSQARRTTGSIALVALLLVALATLVAGPVSSGGSRAPATRAGGHTTRALDALRTVSLSAPHHAVHGDRVPLRAAVASGTAAIGFAAIAAHTRFRRDTATSARGAQRWWGGRCWRAPPATATA